MRYLFVLWLFVFLGIQPIPAAERSPDRSYEAELVVYGGNSAAVSAAVQASRMGARVILVSPDTHLGGLSSGGLGWTDSGRKEVVGGLAREFYHRVWQHYQSDAAWRWQKRSAYGGRGQGAPAIDGDQRTMWIFEPHVAEQIFDAWVEEHDVTVFRDEWLDRQTGVQKKAGRLQSITTLSGKTFTAPMFIDATYEGDLMAAAGIPYHVGREANTVYGETLNGVQTRRALKHQFDYPVDPWVVPGDPSSGLLPRIHSGPPGEDGEGDHRVQAYNFRMCLTTVPENRMPFPKPKGYDPARYELLRRFLHAGSRHVFGKFDPIPNAKTDTNNHGGFSTDNIGMNYAYPDASYAQRREIIREHREYQQGYMYFLANDPGVPEAVRTKMATWGLARDEFTDNGHWPHQMYIREARRMVSDFVVTEHHLRRTRTTPRPVGMGSYNMDSHNVQRYVDAEGRVRNEGDIQLNPGGPFPIDYGAIVPPRGTVGNLLVPVCVSSSHIAYGSIRMEPVFMILGQSAATAACLAIGQGEWTVQDVPYATLRERLLADQQVLEYGPAGLKAASLGGAVVDDAEASLEGTWVESRSVSPFVGAGYRHDGNQGEGQRALFKTVLPKPGSYEVRMFYSAHGNRGERVPVTVHHARGRTPLTVNQRKAPPIKNRAISLGTYSFNREEAVVEIGTENAGGHVIIDAVLFLPVKDK